MSAPVSTRPPRAVFTSAAFGFMSASARSSIMWWFSAVSGACSVTTSLCASSSSSGTYVATSLTRSFG